MLVHPPFSLPGASKNPIPEPKNLTHYHILLVFKFNIKLEDTASFAGLLLAPAEGFGRGFFGSLVKKRAYYAGMAHFVVAIFGVQ